MTKHLRCVIQITPRVPPAVCGVGDYATLVGRRIESVPYEVSCRYIAAGWNSPREGRTTQDKHKFLWETLANERDKIGGPEGATDSVAVLLHYSGYGYSPNGAPEWLAGALENRPSEWCNTKVVTFFHELYATGRPWQRAFWQSGQQRRVAERVARASDALMTNREQSARWLESAAGLPSGSVPHLPVPSNVGEPEEVPPYTSRKPHAVVFGGVRHKRPFLMGTGARKTATLCRRLGVTHLIDIGSKGPIDHRQFERVGVKAIQTGYLSKEKVSRLLLKSRIGFSSYFPGYHDKSGVLGAYIAHGLAVYGDMKNEQELYSAVTTQGQLDTAAERARTTTLLRARRGSHKHAAILFSLLNSERPAEMRS